MVKLFEQQPKLTISLGPSTLAPSHPTTPHETDDPSYRCISLANAAIASPSQTPDTEYLHNDKQ